MVKHKVGDTVWVARCEWRTVQVTCPICFGKREVTLILGNGEKLAMSCDYCRKGYKGPYGTIGEYRYINKPEKFKITAVEIKVSEKGEEVKYMSEHYILYPDKVFNSEADAIKKSEEMKKELEEKQKEDKLKVKKHKNYSWNAGYHLREVKECKRKIEYHTNMARLCKEKARTTSEKV